MKKYKKPQTKMIDIAPVSIMAGTTVNTKGAVKSGDASSIAASRQDAAWFDSDD
jgi:hypothetical protein